MSEIQNCNDVANHLRGRKQFLYDQFGLTSIGVFGSFVSGKQTANSDVVLGIERGKKNLYNFFEVKRLVESEVARKVDLGFLHTLKLVIREKIEDTIKYV